MELSVDQRQDIDIFLWSIFLIFLGVGFVAYLEYPQFCFLSFLILIITFLCIWINTKKAFKMMKDEKAKNKDNIPKEHSF